jgi:hypothetical protein
MGVVGRLAAAAVRGALALFASPWVLIVIVEVIDGLAMGRARNSSASFDRRDHGWVWSRHIVHWAITVIIIVTTLALEPVAAHACARKRQNGAVRSLEYETCNCQENKGLASPERANDR